MIYLFLIALVLPLNFAVGPMRLTLYRMILLVVFLPALFKWLSGRSGRIRIADIRVLDPVFFRVRGSVI